MMYHPIGTWLREAGTGDICQKVGTNTRVWYMECNCLYGCMTPMDNSVMPGGIDEYDPDFDDIRFREIAPPKKQYCHVCGYETYRKEGRHGPR